MRRLACLLEHSGRGLGGVLGWWRTTPRTGLKKRPPRTKDLAASGMKCRPPLRNPPRRMCETGWPSFGSRCRAWSRKMCVEGVRCRREDPCSGRPARPRPPRMRWAGVAGVSSDILEGADAARRRASAARRAVEVQDGDDVARLPRRSAASGSPRPSPSATPAFFVLGRAVATAGAQGSGQLLAAVVVGMARTLHVHFDWYGILKFLAIVVILIAGLLLYSE